MNPVLASRSLRSLAPAACALLLLLAGCAADRQIAPRERLPGEAEIARSLHLGPDPIDGRAGPQWWKRYNDPELDRWIEAGLRDSPAPRMAQARIDRARAMFETASAARLPSAAVGAQATGERFSANGFFPPPIGGSTIVLNDIDLTAHWDADFFGRISSRIEAARGSAMAAQLQAEDARARLAAAIAHAYFSLARAQRLHELAQSELETRTLLLDLVAARVHAGLDAEGDRRVALVPVPQARAELERSAEAVELARNALAALAGAPPQDAADVRAILPAGTLLDPPAGLPLDLLARRADVAAARVQAEATLRTVDAARADFYPDVSIDALAGLDAVGAKHLFELASRTWQVAPAVHLPLFDAGRLRANLRASSAEADMALLAYRGTVLDAAHEAADSLASARSLARQREQLEISLRSAREAQRLAHVRLTAGLASAQGEFLALVQVQTQERSLAELLARAASNDVSLALALGGGANVPLPSGGSPR